MISPIDRHVSVLTDQEIDPGQAGRDARAWYDLGWTRQAAGYPREALDAYERALTLYQADPDQSARLHRPTPATGSCQYRASTSN